MEYESIDIEEHENKKAHEMLYQFPESFNLIPIACDILIIIIWILIFSLLHFQYDMGCRSELFDFSFDALWVNIAMLLSNMALIFFLDFLDLRSHKIFMAISGFLFFTVNACLLVYLFIDGIRAWKYGKENANCHCLLIATIIYVIYAAFQICLGIIYPCVFLIIHLNKHQVYKG